MLCVVYVCVSHACCAVYVRHACHRNARVVAVGRSHVGREPTGTDFFLLLPASSVWPVPVVDFIARATLRRYWSLHLLRFFNRTTTSWCSGFRRTVYFVPIFNNSRASNTAEKATGPRERFYPGGTRQRVTFLPISAVGRKNLIKTGKSRGERFQCDIRLRGASFVRSFVFCDLTRKTIFYVSKNTCSFKPCL